MTKKPPPKFTRIFVFLARSFRFNEITDYLDTVGILFRAAQFPVVEIDYPTACRTVGTLVKVFPNKKRLDNFCITRIVGRQFIFPVFGEYESKAEHI